MDHNQEKVIALTSLYSPFIDCAVSSSLYLNYKRCGIPHPPFLKERVNHTMFIDSTAVKDIFVIYLDHKQYEVIRKYGQMRAIWIVP